jgi:predicted ATP-dependent protease
MSNELKPDQLHRCCDPESLGFKTTADVEPLSGALGQEEAMKALAFGVSVASKGYNIFALGRAGSGRRTFIKRELENRAEEEPTPSSWCYGFNFREPRHPVTLELPAGRGVLLRARLEALITDLKRAIPQALEADDVTNRRAAIYEDRGREANDAMEAFRKGIEDDPNVALIGNQDGVVVVPAHEGEPIKKEAYSALPEETRNAIDETVRDASKNLFQVQRLMHGLQREASDLADELHRQVTRSVVEHRFSNLKEFYGESPPVLTHLDEMAEDIVENWEKFTSTEGQDSQSPTPLLGGPAPEDFFIRYRINPIVTRDRHSGAPVIIESNPSHWALTGRIEGQVRFGVMVTDFTRIAPGALHRANGGYLILHAEELLSRPLAWTALKRSLRTRELTPEDPSAAMGMIVPETLEPEPIPLNVKVILIGEAGTYYRLQQADPEFEELFKVKVDFTPHMDRTPDAERGYASFVAARCDWEELPPFDATAVAAVVEEGSRLASNQWKLSTRFRAIRDLVREAAHVAGGAEVVSRHHVEGAIEDRHRRNNRPHRELLDLIKRGVLSFEPQGERVGQIHGIGLIQVSDEAFGRPIRVMCSAYLGTEGVINIEREALLSGRIHSKGFLILQGFLGRTFARSKPLLLSASLSFDQLYEEIEGDSASAAELYALLSAISGVPIRQDVCITGAINQDGTILPVGGVTEKVEGVFSAFEQFGLTGDQAVIVPRRNVENLVLRRRVREAVADGRFHIYAIDRIEEGWPILTGMAAGEVREDETFPEGTVNRLVVEQLDEFLREWSTMGSEGPSEEKGEEG